MKTQIKSRDLLFGDSFAAAGNARFTLYALLHPDVDLLPSSSVIPPQMKRQEYNELMQQWMTESQNLAKVIALRRKGYEVPIRSDGVEVVEVEEDSPAKGLLIPEDVIVAVDGQPVYLAEERLPKYSSGR